ncbi:hypothetical protein IVB40_07510 [Bradyrhizobium sp. 40]|uniref:hypothetical protein n=1 Tax=Bradyrhizobium sp. 40 TaxID=2782674 RepID=UPI001FFE7AE8|nr:hypothetical protein [Bradyrhizobium sp. 40]UPJ43907.1 hypothetical protein IVB40_07510 [Bradyrhizobium sp. 40]
MSESCAMPRTASTSDTPFGQVADMQRKEIERTVGLELAGCNVCSIVTALDEFDLGRIGKMGHRMETWPEAVRAIMEKELTGFAARNGGARIEAITTAIGGAPKCFILCVHWRGKQ